MFSNKILLFIFNISILANQIKIETENLNYTDYTTGNYNKEFVSKNMINNCIQNQNKSFLNKNNSNVKKFKNYKKILNNLSNIVNNLILDFSNEDPKFFDPYDNNYFQIINRRSFLILLALTVIVLFLSSFYLIRFFVGGCGGYNFKLKKTKLKNKLYIFIFLIASFILFLTSQIYLFKNFNNIKLKINKNFDEYKKYQKYEIKNMEKINRILKQINKKNYKVYFSKIQDENFHISNKVQFIKIKKYKYTKDIFLINVFQNNEFDIVIFCFILFLYILFFYAYKNSKKYYSLILSIIILILFILKFITFSNFFNIFSLNLDINHQIINKYLNKNIINEFNTVMFPLMNENNKFLLKEQYQNIIIAQNSSFSILKQLLLKYNFINFSNLDFCKLSFLNSDLKKDFKMIDNRQINKHLDLIKKINTIYFILLKLIEGSNPNKFIYTYEFVFNDLKIILLFYFLNLIAMGIFWFVAFFSENLIKSMNIQKKLYVNSFKLRHDWS